MSNATKDKPKYSALPKVSIEIVAFTPEQRKNGEQGKVRVVKDTNSWLKQMAALMRAYLGNDDFGTITLTGGSAVVPDSSQAVKMAAFATSALGVQVGTGSTPVDRDDFVEEVKISDGNNPTQLIYDALGALLKTTAITGGYRVQLERNFQNDSGGDITINETGVRVFFDVVGSGNQACVILRDIISPGHTVVNGGAVIIRYLFDWLS